MRKLHIKILILIIVFVWPLPAQEIVVLLTNDYRDFQNAKTGFQHEFARDYPKFKFKEFNIAAAKRNSIKDDIQGLRPRLILAIGNDAAAFAQDQLKEFLIVFAMVHSPEKYAIIGNLVPPITGVTIDIDHKIKLETIHGLLGNGRTVTILYSGETFCEVQKIEKISREIDLSVVSYPVNSEAAIENVLKKLKRNSIFWMLPDPLIYNNKTLNSILKKLNEQEVTVIAPTSKFLQLEYPAHIAISIEPSENGKQAAILGKKLLNGVIPATVVEPPHQIHFFVKKGIQVNHNDKIIWVD